jgi:hypothetical protein
MSYIFIFFNTTATQRHNKGLYEESPAYEALRVLGLLTTQYRRNSVEEIFTGIDIKSNTDHYNNIKLRCLNCAYCLPCWYCCTHTELFVPAGHVGLLMDEQNRYLFAQPGMHNIASCFTRVVSEPKLLRNVIKHGNRTIVVVEQGFIGYINYLLSTVMSCKFMNM